MARFDHGMMAQLIKSETKLLPGNPAVLDIATGPAYLLIELGKRFPSASLTGQDQAESMITIAKEEAVRAGLPINTILSSADRISAGNASFDIVTCKQLFHEAENPKGVLAEAYRVLKPGGKFFLIDFDSESSTYLALAMRTMLRVITGKEIANGFWSSYSSGLPGSKVRQMVSDAGFSQVIKKRIGVNYFISASR
ncbi:MAG: class I SAM-dependent methyltransferase [bacterium]